MEGKKLLALLCVSWSVFCLTECVCPEGLYTTSNRLECCLCPRGFRLMNDCISPRTPPQKCEVCDPGTYLDHPNSEQKCERCKTCDNFANMVEGQRCTPSSNTVCVCKDDHYCDKGDECKVCYPCSTCEFGIKVPCNLTSDTQCNEKAPEESKITTAIAITVPIIALIAVTLIVVFFLWKRKRLCFKSDEKFENPESLELLGDTDLERFLPRISEILGFKVVRNVVRRQGMLSQTIIDNVMDENPRDANERAYQLLKAWYEKHGMKGAYKALTENLIAINMRSKAEEVHELIKELSNRGERRNGDV
ncbi:hypothetical protein PHYPO_G00011870 [Pangasianodon hypophthalmus]|uniref:Tumor necrosis factor receptor superfamily member 6 n=1 Tax=Pangasianodon hypophthalmus TaxID=310915 RepID=A0A5N5N3A8_PANHP|nr:hypothetical protein PHYPO_G00011870 [Pangasianodon hypophthalmus]